MLADLWDWDAMWFALGVFGTIILLGGVVRVILWLRKREPKD